jgi:F0F1-type ATP synthase membrane subunit a
MPFKRFKTATACLLGVLFLLTYVQMFVGIFEGLIQSFVLTMLTTTYLALGVSHEEHEGKEA